MLVIPEPNEERAVRVEETKFDIEAFRKATIEGGRILDPNWTHL